MFDMRETARAAGLNLDALSAGEFTAVCNALYAAYGAGHLAGWLGCYDSTADRVEAS